MSTQRKQNATTKQPGVAVDAAGGAVIDPTANVTALNEASNLRQDDLRDANHALTRAQIKSLRALIKLRAEHAKEINEAESRRVDEQLALRAEYAERLEVAEAKRIDAIRAVDVNAVAVASQRASDQATVLATQVQQSAEALRALVATTAATVAQSQQQLATTLSTRLTTLEQSQYEGKGKQAYTDPVMAELIAEMKSLRQSRSEGTGKSEGSTVAWGYIAAGFGFLLTMAGIAVAAFALFRK